MTRKEAEDARQDKLVELRKKYLDSKGIISKARPSAKVKLTGLDKVEAEREAKLVELREKYLAKKREVTKSVVPTVRKMDTAAKKKPSSGTGRSTVLGTEKYIAKGKRTGTAKPKSVTGRSKVLGTEKYIAKGKRTAKPKYIAKGKRTANIKPSLAPTISVVPKARKFNTEIKKIKKEVVKLNKELTKVKTKPEKTKLQKKLDAITLAFKKKERQGKGSGFRISGAGDDMDFLMKMLKK